MISLLCYCAVLNVSQASYRMCGRLDSSFCGHLSLCLINPVYLQEKRTACKQQNQIPNQANEVRPILSVWRLPDVIAGIRIWRQLACSHRNFPLSKTPVSILHSSVDKYLIAIPPHCHIVCILMHANAHSLASFLSEISMTLRGKKRGTENLWTNLCLTYVLGFEYGMMDHNFLFPDIYI